MQGVLQGFAVVIILIGIGFCTARFMPQRREAIAKGLTPLIYYITNPALMFILLAGTDLHAVVGVFTPIALITAVLTGGVYALLATVFCKTPLQRIPAGAMATSYVNAGNIGVPLALYAVGSTTPVVSVLVAQLLIIAPLYMCLFALVSRRHGASGSAPLGRTILKSVANPVTIATFIGALFSWFQIRLPEVLHSPVQMLGDSSIPLLLLAFGMSLYGQKPLADKALRGEVLLGAGLKVVFMPMAAYLLARVVFGLQGTDLLGVVIMAALPTAQNVLLFSQQFRLNPVVPREVILTSTLLTLPVVLLATFLLT
ncbi:AEC family transporter [Glutamicibacter sp. JL.03c]|uniref:AEC family transporter n=1 Tax=Glutamicibacter sp. JL.03c TaxID=2984842 RepID=UPI0021F72F63|nr:AEC family transporter [Glutamicibacter sp. JL.03c]UYQ76998.1 AEC family transporter [Glutamicibacter sp. JL.03c]